MAAFYNQRCSGLRMKLNRGRDAASPADIPVHGWWQIAKRVVAEIGNDRVGIISAGVAFYMMLAMVPAIGSVIAVYSLVSDPSDVQNQLDNLSGVVPPDALELIDDELTDVVSRESVAGWGLVIGICITLWGASKAMDALIIALNVAYNETNKRNFVTRKLVGLGLTLAAVLFFVIVVLLIGGVPTVLAFAGLDSDTETILSLLRWPVILLAAMTGMAILYRYGPSRKNAKWQWITPGSAIAALVWVLASVGLSWYAGSFGDYNKSYGSLGAVVLLLLWFYLSGFIVMLGAEINSEMELQTARDTTTGHPAPIGDRGAFVADNVAQSEKKPASDDKEKVPSLQKTNPTDSNQ